MNIYSLPQLFTSIILLILIFIIYITRRNNLTITFSLMCFGAVIWLSSCLIMYNIKNFDANLLTFVSRICYLGLTLIPLMYYHFVIGFLKIKSKILIYVDILSFLFIVIALFTPLIVNGMYKYFWGYYPKAGILHPFYIIYSIFLFLICLKHLYIVYKEEAEPLNHLRIKYVFVAFLLGNMGSIDFIPCYNIELYPFGCFNIGIFVLTIAYSIMKYRLMDIKVAVTRTGIFIAVYTLVLGLPFALAVWFKQLLIQIFGVNWWGAPLGLMAILATGGPFLYIYIQRKAEDKLLIEQRQYQQTLKQASIGMTRIRNLRKLLDLITHIVTKTVKISYAAIYLYNPQTNEFELQVSRDKDRIPIPKVPFENPLLTWVMLKREPLIYEEVKRQMEDTGDLNYKLLEENMRMLTASVIIPSFLEDRFLGFFVLGDKMTGQIYTPEDLNVFQVLASQAALAIENAQFYEDTKEMQEQIAQAEKMATIGTMADGLSHQINNRFYALALIAGDTINTVKSTDTSKCAPEIKDMIGNISHALERIQANVLQGGEVVKGILKYTRKGEEGFTNLSLDEVIDGTLEMVQYKVKLSEIDIVRDYTKNAPQIYGNLPQLQEVFFNLIDNAYDAIVERRNALKEDGYRGKITVTANLYGNYLRIISEDNGIGIKEEQIKKIFTPFFTTKATTRKGTGLGLYVIRRIITDTHKGQIAFESKYQTGTRFILDLPLAK